MDWITNILTAVFRAPIDPSIRFALIYIAPTIGLAFILWLARGRPAPFLSWLVPKAVYTHKSNWLDLKLFLANHILGAVGFFGAVVFIPFVAFKVVVALAALSGETYALPPVTVARTAALTVIIVVVNDFSKYWTHRICHEWQSLWPFHAVHHSADVLTPVTVARVHPVEVLIRNIMASVLVGIVQGLALYALIGQTNLLMIGGANVVYVAFNTLGSNFRHSHIWVSYGRVLEHILISPAQHQIHHSAAKKHFNKNYGSIFALWDWMFGTLYIPDSYEDLTYGVADRQGNLKEQPHPTLRAALLLPFAESWQALKDRFGSKPAAPAAPARPHHPAE